MQLIVEKVDKTYRGNLQALRSNRRWGPDQHFHGRAKFAPSGKCCRVRPRHRGRRVSDDAECGHRGTLGRDCGLQFFESISFDDRLSPKLF